MNDRRRIRVLLAEDHNLMRQGIAYDSKEATNFAGAI